MDTMVLLAQGFIGMFNKGGETFVGWVGGIIPTLICLLVAMNSIIAFVGQEKIEKFARICGGNVITRYILLPAASRWHVLLLQSDDLVAGQIPAGVL